MKHANSFVRLITVTLIGMTLATVGQLTLAATAGAANGKPTRVGATHNALSATAKQTAINSSPLTLFIEAPTGDTFRLIYRPDDGWRFADRAVSPKPTEASLTPTDIPRPEESSAADEPLTVLIDGPTGFTYVWMRDAGWKFVGRIANPKRD
jgi:hypothetical protein